MKKSDLYEKGIKIRREMYGDEALERANREVYNNPIMQKFADLATETVFGGVWGREGLDYKTRALICVVSDVATGRENELALHLNFAKRQGWTEDELVEAILHLSGYVGVPLVRGALMVAAEVFESSSAPE